MLNHGKKKGLRQKYTLFIFHLADTKFSFCVTLFIAYTSFKDLLLRNTLHLVGSSADPRDKTSLVYLLCTGKCL